MDAVTQKLEPAHLAPDDPLERLPGRKAALWTLILGASSVPLLVAFFIGVVVAIAALIVGAYALATLRFSPDNKLHTQAVLGVALAGATISLFAITGLITLAVA